MLLGYLHYSPGAAYSLTAEHYRAWAFPAFRYSDLIWLYLRDHLEAQPVPYLDFPLEYPPLTGLLSWLFSWAPDLPTYYALAYLVLAMSVLATVWALQGISGANAWLFAASPAIFFYTGHQWDMAAIAAAALALLAWQRGHDGWAVAGLVAATSLKLFPIVFVAAMVVERLRDRRYRSAAAISFVFAAGTVAVNAPVALANFDGWSYFFRWNRDRLADSGVWVLWRGIPTDDLTRWSLIAALTGGVALTVLAWRSSGSLVIPLGATYLLWWLLVNKTFTTHLMLWAILSLALLSAPWWLWAIATAADLAGFQLGNFLNLYNVPDFRHAPLIRKAVENMYDPMQVARSAVLLACSAWGIFVLKRSKQRDVYAASPAPRASFVGPPNPMNSHEAAGGRRLLTGVGVVFAFIAATLLMTWPYAMHLGDSTAVGFDPFLQIWLSEWIQHSLTTNPRGLYDANVFYPFAQTLAYTDANVPGAIVAMPIRALTGDPVLTNSLLVLASFALASAGVCMVVVDLTGNVGAGLITGLAYAFLPYRMVHLWHLNWLEGALLPWVLLALIRLIDRPTLSRGVVLGLLSGTLVLISFYFSVQIALLFVSVIAAWSVFRRALPSVALTRAAALAILIAAIVTVPLYLPYLEVHEEQRLERSIADAEQYKALPVSYLQIAPWDTPNPLQRLLGVRAGANESLTEVGQAKHADSHQHAEIVIEDALFPGITAAIFAAIGVFGWRDRRWLVLALAAAAVIGAILSLGPTFGPRHGDGQPLPYGWLFDNVPLFRSMRVPARLGGFVELMIVIVAGLGIAAVWQRLRADSRLDRLAFRPWLGPILTAILAAAVLAELWTGGVPLAPVDRSHEARAAADWLASQPPGPVMEFPAESVFADPSAASVRRHYGESMFWSTLHWNPMVNGNSGFIPGSYSDFIERFVGALPRPDGSLTSRISHLDLDTARLLQQIGVRYVVFDHSRYLAVDWPAIELRLSELVEAGTLTPDGAHGQSVIYTLNPTLPSVAGPEVRIFAPTLLTPANQWAPWIAVESTEGTPMVLALTRPTRLETTWYDADGRQLWRGSQRIPLPAVIDDPEILCDAKVCLTARQFTDLTRLPPPGAGAGWIPDEPGHYVVKLRLLGDHEIDCRVDLDVVADAAEIRNRAGDDAHRWAECVAWSPNPINNPGAVPFLLSPPSVTFVDDVANVDIAVSPRANEEVRAWFILSPPETPEPWLEAEYQSPVQQKLLSAKEPVHFNWSEPLGDALAPGVYELTLWIHRRGNEGWEHAAGGDVGLSPVVVGEDRILRWAGPIRAHLAQPPPLVAGQSTPIELTITGASNRVQCDAEWQLTAVGMTVASGHVDCDRPEILIPADVPPGRYRLQVVLFSVKGDKRALSDSVAASVTILEHSPVGEAS